MRDADAESTIGNSEDVGALLNDDRNVRGHAGLELRVFVADINDGSVRDDALAHTGGVAHHPDVAGEGAVGEGIDGELNLLAFGDAADVGLGDGGVDLHFGEVVHEGEQHGSVHASVDGAALVGFAVEDHAVDRGDDGAAGEVELRIFDRGGAGEHRGVRLGELGLGVVEFGLRHEFLTGEFARALGSELQEAIAGLGGLEIGFGLFEALGGRGFVDAGEDVAGFYLGIKVDENLFDLTGNLGTDVDGDDGLEVAGRSHGLGDIAPGDFGGLELRRLIGLSAEIIPCAVAAAAEDEREENETAVTFRFGHENRGTLKGKRGSVGGKKMARNESFRL